MNRRMMKPTRIFSPLTETLPNRLIKEKMKNRKLSDRKYLESHRAQINDYRRRKRKEKKLAQMQGKKCLNCDILMVERCKGTRIYCESCIKNYPKEVRRHSWNRYYKRKKEQLTAPDTDAFQGVSS